MITKIPLRIARTLLPMNYSGLRLYISESIIEKNHLYQLIERGMIFETMVLKNTQSNSDQTEIKGFKVQDLEDDLKLELSKTVGNVQILICIECQNKEETFEEELLENQKFTVLNQTETLVQNCQTTYLNHIPFSIYLTKGNGIISCYECSAYRSKIQINMIQIIDDIEEHKQIPRQERGITDYIGRNYIIDDTLQNDMLNYLKTFGIDSELAQFVENLQSDREQALYLKWLQNKINSS
ncbi:unnamed protein product [Paramecium primaurelia]|uniref:Uncharacterized protein n=1 Tax=Paramecium primaurelia TaxID=5886 RepID=A0A8S1MI10_PARPR|nr:unnamed protein product [Paramecium primaurelia]